MSKDTNKQNNGHKPFGMSFSRRRFLGALGATAAGAASLSELAKGATETVYYLDSLATSSRPRPKPSPPASILRRSTPPAVLYPSQHISSRGTRKRTYS